jgi:hypothetical protein
MPTTEELMKRVDDLSSAINDRLGALHGQITKLVKQKNALEEANVLLVVTLQKIRREALKITVPDLEAQIDSALEAAKQHIEKAE